jgi:hypothetical protein
MGPDGIASAIDNIQAKIDALKAQPSLPDFTDQFIQLDPKIDFKPQDLDVSETLNKFFENADISRSVRPLVEDLQQFGEIKERILEGNQDGIENGINATLRETDRSLQELGDRAVEAEGEISSFADEAARNMQGAFADFLFDPFEDGLKGMAKGFVDVIRRMIAEAAAAKILETLFGKNGNSSGGSNAAGWLDTLVGAFGGGKAKGGPLDSGKWYVAGEHGPEPIWGGGSGAFAMGYGGGGGGGSVTVVNENHFHEVRDVTDAKMAVYSQRISDGTVGRIRDMKRRGTL